MPCAASPPSTFCQDQVTTSSFCHGRSMAKAAEVASQRVRPSRPSAIQSPEGTLTPEVVPFQVNTTSREKSRSEEHTSELQSLMRISYAVFCLKKKKINQHIITLHKHHNNHHQHTVTIFKL